MRGFQVYRVATGLAPGSPRCYGFSSERTFRESQRAVQAGELSRAEAPEDQQVLTEVRVCMMQDEHAWRGLPQRLVALLDKSHRLYIRVARLDELARRSVN